MVGRFASRVAVTKRASTRSAWLILMIAAIAVIAAACSGKASDDGPDENVGGSPVAGSGAGKASGAAGAVGGGRGGSPQASGGDAGAETTKGGRGGNATGGASSGGSGDQTGASGGTGNRGATGGSAPAGGASGEPDGGGQAGATGGVGGSSAQGGGGGQAAGSAGLGGTGGANDGIWIGAFSDGGTFRGVIVGGQITIFDVIWGNGGDFCGPEGEKMSAQSPVPVTIDAEGKLEGTLTFSQSGAYVTCDTSGAFAGDNAAGSFDCSYLTGGDCGSSDTLTFTATRASALPTCGNDSVDWPEQCDDGNATSSDGCSSSCLLEGTTEKEPNDDGDVAVGQDDYDPTPLALTLIQTDTLVSASLAPAGDEDMVRVFGSSSDTETSVRIETFGRGGPGTCDLDTVMELYDRKTGVVVASDDDSGVGSCSSITYAIPAQFPVDAVNVHIGAKGDATPAGLYFVSVTYL